MAQRIRREGGTRIGTVKPRRRTATRPASPFNKNTRSQITRPPTPQTRGRTTSASGTITRPKVSPVPTPTPGPSGQVAPPSAPAPAPAAPAPPDVSEPGAGAEGDLDSINIAAIEAALAAIEAQFGLTREQLLADDSEIGRTYRLLIAQANRANEASIEAVLGNALERGIVRSGIFAENVAEVETLTAESVSDLSAQQAAGQAATQSAIAQAQSTAAQAKLTAAQQRGADVLSLEELEALLKAGLS